MKSKPPQRPTKIPTKPVDFEDFVRAALATGKAPPAPQKKPKRKAKK